MDIGVRATGDQKLVSHRDIPLIMKDSKVHLPTPIHNLLMEFEDLFATPQSLPPPRILDYSIHLKRNSEPVNLKAYRYSHIQKAEIEKLIREMLSKNPVQPSQSPYASLVLLVKKKDGT